MALARSVIDGIKLEIDHLEVLSSGYESKSMDMDSSASSTTGQTTNAHSSLLEEFDRSVRKITNDISSYRDLASKDECLVQEKALAESLAALYLKTDEISQQLIEKTQNFANELDSKARERMIALKDDHDDDGTEGELGEITRNAVRYGRLKSKAASMDDMCSIVEGVKKFGLLYQELINRNDPTAGFQPSSIELHSRKKGKKMFSIFCLGMLFAVIMFVFRMVFNVGNICKSVDNGDAGLFIDMPCDVSYRSANDYFIQ